MRILIDEDLASRELIRRLEAVMPGGTLRAAAGTSDEDVWRQAHDAGAVIVTGNVVDFVRLARERPDHHGLLLVYRRNDPADLRAAGIAAGVEAIAAAYPAGLDRLVLAVNDFAR